MANNRNDSVAIGIRLPKDTADWIKREAETTHRSVSNFTAWALEQYRKQQEGTQHAQPT